MAEFYARYVPPSRKVPKPTVTAEETSKRKRDVKPENPKEPARSKRQKTANPAEDAKVNLTHRQTSKAHPEIGDAILKKYSLTQFAHTNGSETTRRSRKKSKEENGHGARNFNKDEAQSAEPGNTQEFVGQNGSVIRAEATLEPIAPKHSGIFSRFERSRAWSAKHGHEFDVNNDDESMDETMAAHGLEPIPQPTSTELPQGKPSFSALPTWQSNALTIDGSTTQAFATMNISSEVVRNLKKHKIENAFPVQATLIPLLLGAQETAVNDICVSATTGSGKTLAYVIPIVEDLQRSKQRGLRAVIVVPTRELVQQVKETCELCAAGSGLRIATTVGNKSLKEEQNALIEVEDIYDPVRFKEQQDAPINWSTFDLAEEMENARQGSAKSPPNYVVQKHITADILITTPGRLVDHLKRTDGFHLDDTRWLIIDEADRLLNESYQEWIEVVVPSLQSRQATKQRDDILRAMRMDLPPRRVCKILLSATMTRDISKLNALGLREPKLIILNSTSTATHLQEPVVDTVHDDFEGVDEGVYYDIPATLSESVVILKEGAEKPLLLVQLLEKILKTSAHIEKERQINEKSDSTSSSGSDDTSDSETSDSFVSSSSDSEISNTSDDESSSTTTSTSEDTDVESNDHTIAHHQKDPRKASNSPRVLIFTKSTSSATRLTRLLGLLLPQMASDVAALTRSTGSSSSSRKALAAFRTGKIPVLISTDRASRGVDVPGLEHVINYDVPASALTYVHRVGRTARAGMVGHGWTLLEHREGRWFWTEIGGKGEACRIRRSTRIQRTEGRLEDEALQQRYEMALQKLGEEARGRQS